MKSDYDLIVHKLAKDLPYINIYPIGDAHEGSECFSEEAFYRWKKAVLTDPFGYAVICGDMFDNTLKNSKGNSYDNRVRPREQKEFYKRELRDLYPFILGAVQGNHENRTTQLTDDCPLYDVMSKFDIEDLYRPNMAFMKVSLGTKNADRQFAYTLVLAHGASKSKTEKFSYAVDNMDVFITAHIHQPSDDFPMKIVIDDKNECVRFKETLHITLPSFQYFGGYALKGMYLPKAFQKFPVITLSGKEKDFTVTWK